jgi:hypothetical protein
VVFGGRSKDGEPKGRRPLLAYVTGGTGVGSHSIAAIVEMGNRVRLLVRDESRVDRVLTREYVQELREIAERRLLVLFLPTRAMLPVGRLADLAQHAWPWHIPTAYGAIYTCACATRVADDTCTCGIDPRPVSRRRHRAVVAPGGPRVSPAGGPISRLPVPRARTMTGEPARNAGDDTQGGNH